MMCAVNGMDLIIRPSNKATLLGVHYSNQNGYIGGVVQQQNDKRTREGHLYFGKEKATEQASFCFG